ncbi:MAG: FAD-dependent monooxygenase [Alphaproteobacteria bacterium]|nr:FAD-dependent monooxygenase [Alphaproteobacteria bacterium]
MPSYDVIIAGAGPVGLTLAIDLGRRGVRCLIMERHATTAPWPKMDRSNARTMEFYRRIGIVDRVRALGYPADNPMDVFLLTRMSEPAIAVLKYPSVAERRAQIAACFDGSMPLEPYQLVSQNKLEPLLKEVAEATPNVTVRYGCAFEDLVQDEAGVDVHVRRLDGGAEILRGRYLVGCDGGSSTVRKTLGIALQGRGGLRELRQVMFFSDELYERIVAGKGRHYNFADVNFSSIIAQGDRKEFTLHSTLPEGTDFHAVLRDLIGFDCKFEIRHVLSWRHNLLVAEHYRDRRVFLAGDAVHLVIPSGGLGMNTGVGDAFDLSWKLAGVIKGWGGPGLLDGYEIERRPIGLRNRDASGWAASAVPVWRALVTPQIRDATPEGAALRARVAASFSVNHRYMHDMVGVETWYSYAGSPLIADEPGNVAHWETSRYTPHARPGVRVAHMWLADGRALQDILGDDYTLLDLRGDCDARPLQAAFRALGAPLDVVRRDEPRVRDVFGRSVLLLRPDLHIAWSGHGTPPDPEGLAARVTGQAAPAAARAPANATAA